MTSKTLAGAAAADARAGFSTAHTGLEVGLLTGGIDKPYAFGLAMALVSNGVRLDFIGSDENDSPELHTSAGLTFLNLRGSQHEDAKFTVKVRRILSYYGRLVRYAALARPKIFHILWNNKFESFDRTLLLLYYKLCSRRIVLTAHNVNASKRDSNDSLLNRLTLRIQYQLADHIFVHTERMKAELMTDFDVREERIGVIPLGFNNSAPNTSLTPAEAKRSLGIPEGDRTILFFGAIGPYKGLECLVGAFQQVARQDPRYRLLVVGKPKMGCEEYIDGIQRSIHAPESRGRVMQRLEFIPDDETEQYFKASDVVVLPYTEISQSGVLVLGYSFGLPVVASDVGSLRDDIIEGKTGFLFKSGDAVGLAKTIEAYFASPLFADLDQQRSAIQEYARQKFSWELVAEKTSRVYAELM